jgi:hypothetical protein
MLVVGLATIIGATVAAVIAPVLAVVGVALVVATGAALRLGLLPTVTSACIALLGISGALSIYIPASASITQACVLTLIALGVIGLFRVRVPLGVALPAILFVLIATLASVLMIERSVEFALRGWTGLVTPVFVAIAAASAVHPRRPNSTGERNLVFGAILGVVVLNSFWAARQALFGLTPQETRAAELGESTYAVGDQIRLMGTFATNQDFGLFTACLAPALLVIGLNAVRYRRLMLLASALVYIVVLLSLTRTALLASVVVGIFVLFVWGRGPVIGRVARVAAVSGAILVLGVAVLSQIQNARIQDSLARAGTLFELSGDTSFVARLSTTLPRGLAAFNANPWGSGAGSAGPVSSAFPNQATFGKLTTDNGYLLIAIQTGVFGLLAFVAMLVTLAVWLGRQSGRYSRAGSAAVIALLVAMFLAGYWGLLAPISIVAAMVGIGIADAARGRALRALART